MEKLVLISLILLTKNLLFSTGVEIINIPVGNSSSLANEKAIINNYGFSLFTNPAVLININSNYTIEYNRLFYYNKTTYDILSLTSKSFDKFCAGLSFGRFTSGEINLRNIDGIPTGENFEYSMILSSLGMGVKLSEDDYNVLNFGFSGVIILEKIDTENIFFGYNTGLLHKLKIKTKFLKGILLGGSINGVSTDKKLNYNASFGLQTGNSIVFIGYEGFILSNNEKIKIGTMLNLYTSKDLKKYFNLNIGYQTNTNYLSSGIDFRIYNFGLCYSFGNHKYLGALHSLQIILFI